MWAAYVLQRPQHPSAGKLPGSGPPHHSCIPTWQRLHKAVARCPEALSSLLMCSRQDKADAH